MKKIILQLLLVLPGISASPQIIMDFNGKKYDISEVDSIVFRNIEIPSATNCMEMTNEYSIFVEALHRTGIADSLITHEKDNEYVMTNPTDRDGYQLYYPKRCDIGWTVFAEKDSVFNALGIYNFTDLANKCIEWYGNPIWYDLVRERNIKISTGTDYTNEWNAVHMFVAYHIVRAKMAAGELVYERNTNNYACWNYCFGYEPQAYYETMLSGTLVKVWATDTRWDHLEPKLWLNRYIKNNTLTDQYGTFGSDVMHPLIFSGAQIDRNASIWTINACIHSIDKVLLYDKNTRDSQHERMRFHINQLLPELATNNIMRATPSQISVLNNYGSGESVSFPTDFFDNLCCYENNSKLRYKVTGMWRALESSMLYGWDKFDFAIRLPYVPSGNYEIRYLYTPSSYTWGIGFYIGNSKDSTMMKLVRVLDTPENPYYGKMGYVQINPDEGEYGIEAGKTMREKGYMYAPASFSRGTYNTITKKLIVTDNDPYLACKQILGSSSCRTESGYGTLMLRFIVGVVDMKQSQEYWLRIKSISGNDWRNSWMLNCIELVPTDVAENNTYMEDWY